jgi:hypothetical protein
MDISESIVKNINLINVFINADVDIARKIFPQIIKKHHQSELIILYCKYYNEDKDISSIFEDYLLDYLNTLDD